MKGAIRNFLIAVAFTVSFVSTASAQLAKCIDSIISQNSQKKVEFSIHIIKADSAETVYSRDAERPLIPASNMKLITTAAAIRFLGPDYEYKTQVGLCGDTLVVVGSGDPLLGDKVTDARYGRQPGWIFEDIAAILKKNGLTTIKDIVVDTGIFDDQRVHPNWPEKQLNRWYASEVSGLNFNGNCVDIAVENNSGKTKVYIEPQTGFFRVVNKVEPIRKGKSSVGSYRGRQPNEIVVFGKCRDKAGPFAVAIERPAAFFGVLLAENLSRAGIDIEGLLLEKPLGRDHRFRKLTEYRTALTDCLARCNKDSFGLAADALLKTIAANAGPDKKNGSWAGGRAAIHGYLLALGIEENQFFVDDGSGLSRQNKLSANAVTTVLSDVYKSGCWKIYKDSLAAGGVDGTISKYFKEKKYEGKVFGKTGYISGVKSFSGLCSTADGDYLFSILTNNANDQTRKAINDIVKAIID
jgi:D-alanyl-D-alanine carboxypeptidase/D-alanyl-D-alanine-endopeptidase (penicillin-binding protein 4)